VVQITFLRRIRGRDHAGASVEPRADVAPPLDVEPPVEDESPQPTSVGAEPPLPEAALLTWVACPNCGVALDPPPEHTRLCPSCRRRIVVRHSEGRAVYLTEAAVEVFESVRQHEIDEQTWTRERHQWLHLAQLTGAPADRRQLLAAAPLTAAVVQSSRSLYLGAAERAVRAARGDKRWDDVARIRRRQAAALFEEAGARTPPGDEIVALHQEAAAATLRALAAVSREVELVGASCCRACRADDERIFQIAAELREPRLPHAGCPRGLCACDWWPAIRKPATKRRRRTSTAPRPAAPAAPAAPAGDDAPPPDDRGQSGADTAEPD